MMGRGVKLRYYYQHDIGDRSYALLDLETDKVVAPRIPKKWPEIFSFMLVILKHLF